MEQARQLNNQQQQQQPQQQRLEVVVIAGQDLKSITSFLSSGSSKMSSYVVCWVDPRSKVSTRIVKRGGRDPVWNHPLALPVDAAALANPYACLTLQVMSSSAYPSRYDAVVGTAWMPLHEIARLSASASAVDSNAVTLAVQRLCVCLIGAGLDAPPRFQPPPKALLAPPQLQLQHQLQHQNQHQNQQQQRLSPPSFSSSSSYSGLFDDLRRLEELFLPWSQWKGSQSSPIRPLLPIISIKRHRHRRVRRRHRFSISLDDAHKASSPSSSGEVERRGLRPRE